MVYLEGGPWRLEVEKGEVRQAGEGEEPMKGGVVKEEWGLAKAR